MYFFKWSPDHRLVTVPKISLGDPAFSYIISDLKQTIQGPYQRAYQIFRQKGLYPSRIKPTCQMPIGSLRNFGRSAHRKICLKDQKQPGLHLGSISESMKVLLTLNQKKKIRYSPCIVFFKSKYNVVAFIEFLNDDRILKKNQISI